MNALSRLSIIGACLLTFCYAASARAQSSTEICSIFIWNPDGPENSAKCYVPEEDSDLDFTNRLVAQAINTTESESDFTRIELKMLNPDSRFCQRFGGHWRVKCVVSPDLIEWTEFTKSTEIWNVNPTIPLLALSCSCF